MSRPNNRAEQLATAPHRTDFLAHTCQYSKAPMTGIKVGKAKSTFEVLVFSDSTFGSAPMIVITIEPPNSPMRLQDHLTPADARILAAGLIAAADHHDAITAREAEALAFEAAEVQS